jgi:hypothetical protein
VCLDEHESEKNHSVNLCSLLSLFSNLFTQLNCDFNCCCDLDCSDESVEAFDCSTSVVDIDIEDFYHGEGLERCGINGGLFCIANMPSVNSEQSVSASQISLRMITHHNLLNLIDNSFNKLTDSCAISR